MLQNFNLNDEDINKKNSWEDMEQKKEQHIEKEKEFYEEIDLSVYIPIFDLSNSYRNKDYTIRVKFPLAFWIKRTKPLPSEYICFGYFRDYDELENFDITLDELLELVEIDNEVIATAIKKGFDLEIKILISTEKKETRKPTKIIKSFDFDIIGLFSKKVKRKGMSLIEYMKKLSGETEEEKEETQKDNPLRKLTAEEFLKLQEFNLLSNRKEEEDYYEEEDYDSEDEEIIEDLKPRNIENQVNNVVNQSQPQQDPMSMIMNFVNTFLNIAEKFSQLKGSNEPKNNS